MSQKLRGRSKFVRAKAEINEKQEIIPNRVREMQEAICEAIDDHLAWFRTRNEPPDKQEGKEFDLEMLIWIQTALGVVLDGHHSEFLEPTIKGSGVLGRSPFQKKLIENAVFYRYCVEAKLIADTAPMKRISELYGVSREAVHKWVKDPEFEHVKRHDPENPPFPQNAKGQLEANSHLYRKLYSPLRERKSRK